jgi:hypothetical protein
MRAVWLLQPLDLAQDAQSGYIRRGDCVDKIFYSFNIAHLSESGMEPLGKHDAAERTTSRLPPNDRSQAWRSPGAVLQIASGH